MMDCMLRGPEIKEPEHSMGKIQPGMRDAVDQRVQENHYQERRKTNRTDDQNTDEQKSYSAYIIEWI